MAEIGDPRAVDTLDSARVKWAVGWMQEQIEGSLDRMKLSKDPEPVIVVGGGSILVGGRIAGASEVVRPPHFDVANAVGAAIGQISGEVDQIFPLAELTRAQAVERAREQAVERATEAGAARETVRIVDVEDIPVAYMEGSMIRVRAKAVGELAAAPAAAR
jgi:hypothetical protein